MPLVGEEWKAVVGWEGLFKVSSFGRVRSFPRLVRDGLGSRLIPGHLMQCTINMAGYVVTQLSDGRRKAKARVHMLVLEAFVGPRPTGMECRHFPDRDRTNNRLGNLQWGTPTETLPTRLYMAR